MPNQSGTTLFFSIDSGIARASPSADTPSVLKQVVVNSSPVLDVSVARTVTESSRRSAANAPTWNTRNSSGSANAWNDAVGPFCTQDIGKASSMRIGLVRSSAKSMSAAFDFSASTSAGVAAISSSVRWLYASVASTPPQCACGSAFHRPFAIDAGSTALLRAHVVSAVLLYAV